MNEFVDSFAYWLADYYLATTVLFAVALVALALMKQPAKRMAVVKAALLAAVLLTFLCALPGWSLVHLATTTSESPRPTAVTPIVNATPAPSMPVVAQGLPIPIPTDVMMTPAVSTAPNWSQSWLAIVLAAYSLGSAAVLLRLVLGMAFARRLLNEAAPAPAEVEGLLTTVLTEESSRPRLRVSREIDVAAAIGVIRATVLLPKSWAVERATSELRTVLAHECAHVRNGDLKWLAISRLASVALWPQPLYWLVRRRMRLDQEALADAAAAEVSSRVTYAEQLVAWARAVPSQPRPALASAVGLWESPSQLRRRVALLLDEHFPVLRECSRRLRWASLLVCGLIAVVLSAITIQPANSDPAVDNVTHSRSASSEAGTEHSVVGGGTLATFVAGNPATPWDFKPNAMAIFVQDESGKPLGGVEADVYRVAPHSGEGALVQRATTDAQGSVEFVGLVDAKRAAKFEALDAKSQFPLVRGDVVYTVLKRSGLATLILPVSDFTLAGRGVKRSVRMRPAAELGGRVTDREGKPVEGATVAAGGIAGFFVLDGVNAVKTDADGRYRFSDRVAFNREAANKRIAEQNQWSLAADRDMSKMYPAVYDPAEDTSVWDLYVTHPDFAVTTVRGGNVPGTQDVIMQPAASIEGRVVEAFGTGESAAGVLVRAAGAPIPIDSDVLNAGNVEGDHLFLNDIHNAATRTDARGHYRLANLPAGKYDVWAEAPSDDAGRIAWIMRGVGGVGTKTGATSAIAPDLVIGPGGLVHGQLLDGATGQPLSFADPGGLAIATVLFVDPTQQQLPVQQIEVTPYGQFDLLLPPGEVHVFLSVQNSRDTSKPQGDYRSSDSSFQSGPPFASLGHGESTQTNFVVWSRAKLDEKRQEQSRAFQLVNDQKYDEAIAAFAYLIEDDPLDVSAMSARAALFEKLGRDAEAVADYEILSNFGPGYKSRLVELLSTSPDASIRNGRRAVELATQVLEATRQKPPNEYAISIALMQLAAAQAEAGDFDAAVATQREAIEASTEQARDSLRDRLKLYEARKPYHREAQEKSPTESKPQSDNAEKNNATVSGAGANILREIRLAAAPILAEMAEKHGYGLAEGQDLRRVAPPFPPIRMQYYQVGHPTQSTNIPMGPAGMLFRWADGKLTNWGMTFGQNTDDGYSLRGVLDAVVGVKGQEIDAAKALLEQRISGDWVVRAGASDKELVRELQAILQIELSLPIRLEFRDVPREVYVARGDYKLTPLPGHSGREEMHYENRTVISDEIEIFGKQLVPDSGAGGGTGSYAEFLKWLGEWVGATIVSDAKGVPTGDVSWNLHQRSPFTEQMQTEDRDPKLVLANITAQTGLTFAKETRPVRILTIEEIK